MTASKETTPADGLHQNQDSWSPYARLPESLRLKLRRLWIQQGFNPDVASKLRYELDMVLLRARRALSPRQHRQEAELSQRQKLKLHLGCGNALLPEWLNIDCYPPTSAAAIETLMIDMRRKWPLSDGSASVLFTEHFLEHLPFDTVRGHILHEIFRVLESGGHVRIGVPNGQYFVDQLVACRDGGADPLFENARHGKTPMTMLNEIINGYGHYFVYDFETLGSILSEAGFVEIRQMMPGETQVAAFKGLDRSDAWRKAMSLYVEATRP